MYVATPYSKFPGGLEAAYEAAAQFTAELLRAGVKAYSPICHTHPIAVYGKIDPYAHEIWLPFDEAVMERSDALLVAKLESWDQSKGIQHEIDFFQSRAKPVYFSDVI